TRKDCQRILRPSPEALAPRQDRWRKNHKMHHKTILGMFVASILIGSAALTAGAQVGQLRGHVVIKQADGQTVPASDAAIDVYRTDVSGKYNTKTNKKGEFIFAGLPFVGTYVIAASHPSARPNFVPGV